MDEKEALLSQLKTVHVPDVSAVPAIGWWVLLIVLIATIIAGLMWRRRYRSRQWQREAQLEIARIRHASQEQTVATTLADTSRLARKLLLLSKPREEVAALHGSDWLQALDDVCDRPLFAEGFGKLLLSNQYQKDPKVNPSDLNALLDAMDELIQSSVRYVK